ncbi:MAG: serine hydrolase [Ignavibacteriales bacterium]|nr:serine hydrolase [Ignavibacteriales bacterium]
MKKIILLSIVIGLITVYSNNSRNGNSDSTKYAVVISNDTCKLIDNYLTKLTNEKNFSGGLLIVKDGKKIFSKGYGWADKDKRILFTSSTLASIGSITKAFTAAAIMKLVEQNELSLDDQLKKYFPTIPEDKANITIHQLLTHSSGFHEFLKQDGGDYEKINTEEFLNRAFAEPLAFKPGEKAVYTNVGFSVLGIIIEQVSGLDYEEFLKTNLFQPLGIKDIGYHYPAASNDTIAIGYRNGKIWGTHQQHFEQAGGGPYWNLKANGGLEVSLDEMFLWANSFTNHSILSESTIQKMFTAHIQEEGYNGESFFGYGCNILQSRRNTKMIDNGGSNGIYFARLIRLPEEGLVFYMVTNESSIHTMMVLPNVTQLYFNGKIEQDALTMQPVFQNQTAKQIYEILEEPTTTDLATELNKNKIKVEDDMVLLEVGQLLIQENKTDKALVLYKFYTKTFPNIVVAWNDLGDIYLTQNNKDEAIKCYQQALKIRPENPRAKESLDKLTK